MKIHRVATLFALAAAGLVVLSACSSSRSSKSSSSSSRSSSASSGGGGAVAAADQAFAEEIAAIAVLYAGSRGSAEDFQRDVGDAAKRNGIPYWELDERVFSAIGTGLKRAGVPKEQVPHLPFLAGVRNAQHFAAVTNAYR